MEERRREIIIRNDFRARQLIRESFDAAKSICVEKINHVLDEAINPKLNLAMDNATEEYVKLNQSRLKSEKRLRDTAKERFRLLRRGADLTYFTSIYSFLDDKNHSHPDRKSLKYLFVHQLLNVTAETDAEAADLVNEMKSRVAVFTKGNHIPQFSVSTNHTFSHPLIASIILRNNPDLAEKIIEQLNHLYPEHHIGNDVIQVLDTLPDDAKEGRFFNFLQNISWQNNSFFNKEHCSITEFYLFHTLFPNPFHLEAEIRDLLKALLKFLASESKKGIDENSFAYHMTAALLGERKEVVSAKKAALLVQSYQKALVEKLYPGLNKLMLFGEAGKKMGVPKDVEDVIKQTFISLKK
jgi:hypothetical protein